jgi:2-iminoacetate synthase
MVEINNKLDLLNSCLNSDDKEFDEYYNKAKELTNTQFGNKRKLFNPIYVSDICLADCPYCGYRISNKGIPRKTLKPLEVVQEANYLGSRGVSNLLLLAGDYKHSKYVEMLSENISALKKQVNPNWIGIEVATLEVSEYAKLKNAGAESVTVFQETYNRKRYAELHTVTEYKGDFDNRYNAQERAIKGGFEEVGFGVLYGVGFWKEDTLQMAEQALDLQEKYPNVKLRFSFPRLQLSKGQDESCKTEEVTEGNIEKAFVGIRLLFPNASMVLTGRESVNFLTEYASVVDTLGYNGATNVGGYTGIGKGLNQFQLNSENDFSNFKNQLEKKYDLD